MQLKPDAAFIICICKNVLVKMCYPNDIFQPHKDPELWKRKTDAWQIIILLITHKTVEFIHLNTLANSLYFRTFCVDTYMTSYLRWKAVGKFRKYSRLPFTPDQKVGPTWVQSSLNCYAPLHIINTCIGLEVMWRPEVTYSNVLKFFITLGSASAVTPSSPIPVHLYLSQSRLVEWRSQQ